MYFYSLLLLFSIIGPVIVSQFQPYKSEFSWVNALKASLVISIPFLIWDYFFTKYGFWGFNSEYLLGFEILGLPLEEILFFIVIPISSIFLFTCVKTTDWSKFVTQKTKKIFIVGLVIMPLLLSIIYSREYTVVVSLISFFTSLFIYKQVWLKNYIASLPLILIAFLVVNGALTYGLPMVSPNPVVWYDPQSFSSIRLGSIPIEDFIYAHVLLSLNILIYDKLSKPNL